MQLTARNQIPGKIMEVKKGAVNAEVFVEIVDGIMITANTTVSAVEDLQLSEGKKVLVIIKASDVMIGLE